MKTCCDCRAELPLACFHRRGSGHQSVCKLCRKKRDQTRTYDQQHRDRWRRERREWLTEYKRDKPCVDCGGVFHPAAMQFDHLPEHTKVKDISTLVVIASLETVLEEIAKCEIVCANCHAVRTHNRRVA